MYKDKDKQREANRQAMRKIRAKGITNETSVAVSQEEMVIPKPNLCKYCGKELEFDILECCYDCALKQPTKVSPSRAGHILSSRPALEFTGKLTAYEREHYNPASERMECNPVSKPGDSHYRQGVA